MLCNGCRAKPLRPSHGDYLDEDLWSLNTPKGGRRIEPLFEEEIELVWEKEVKNCLERLPYFLRKMIKGRVERYAKGVGKDHVILQMMEDLRKKILGKASLLFSMKGCLEGFLIRWHHLRIENLQLSPGTWNITFFRSKEGKALQKKLNPKLSFLFPLQLYLMSSFFV